MKLLRTIKDFYHFNKEFKIPQVKKSRDIVDVISGYMIKNSHSFEKISKMREKLDSMVGEYKIESEKEYSERKYELLDEYSILYDKISNLRNKIIDDCVTMYYSKHKGNLFDDMDEVIKWMPSSRYLDDKEKDVISNLSRILSDSDIKKDLDNFNNW
jgi:hypothetical protein